MSSTVPVEVVMGDRFFLLASHYPVSRSVCPCSSPSLPHDAPPGRFPVSWNTFGTFLPLSLSGSPLATHTHQLLLHSSRHHHYPNHCHYCLFSLCASLPFVGLVHFGWNFGTHIQIEFGKRNQTDDQRATMAQTDALLSLNLAQALCASLRTQHHGAPPNGQLVEMADQFPKCQTHAHSGLKG